MTYDIASIRKEADDSLRRQHSAQQVPAVGLAEIIAATLRAAFTHGFAVEVIRNR